ncbi:MAG: hypothetical protein HKN80_11550 [Acidimicrobiia bacterium]|nr:hypothetical protein [Acidimicrobiia bacterium]
MDIGVDLVEAYLRLNGYFTITEFEVLRETTPNNFQTVTDVDVIAVRFPGPIYIADSHGKGESPALLVEDPVLGLEPDTVDVIIGEVKQGEAVFNPGLTDHHTLHTVLQRVAWLYDDDVRQVARDLEKRLVFYQAEPPDRKVRTRLVAFGRSPVNDMHTISLTHVFDTMIGQFEEYGDALRAAQFKNPAAALIRLLVKTGFEIKKDAPED